jgi:hypothetical protein
VLRAVRRGYVVNRQDVRGRYGSDGVFTPSLQEGADGYDSVQWAAGLPYCDGTVGMWGQVVLRRDAVAGRARPAARAGRARADGVGLARVARRRPDARRCTRAGVALGLGAPPDRPGPAGPPARRRPGWRRCAPRWGGSWQTSTVPPRATCSPPCRWPTSPIRVDVTSSSPSRWNRNLNTGASAYDSAATAVARQRIFHDPDRPSRLTLTVVG